MAGRARRAGQRMRVPDGETVHVALGDAMTGRLPAVCVMTGERADGYAPMVVPKRLGVAWLLLLAGPIGAVLLVALYPRLRTRYVVRVPMSADAFARWHTARLHRLWCAWLGIMGLALALGIRWIGPLAGLIALVAVLLVGVALRAHWQVPWLQPSMSADPAGRRVTMRGVHIRFVQALARPRIA